MSSEEDLTFDEILETLEELLENYWIDQQFEDELEELDFND